MRKLNDNNYGVVGVFETMLLLGITISLMSTVMVTAPPVVEGVLHRLGQYIEWKIDAEMKKDGYQDQGTNTTPTTPDPTNNPPTAFSPVPFDNQFNLPIKPTLKISVQDLDKNLLTVCFYWKNITTDSRQLIKRIDNVASGDMVSAVFEQAIWYVHHYHWWVTVSDGQAMVTSPTYSFTTMDMPSPPGGK